MPSPPNCPKPTQKDVLKVASFLDEAAKRIPGRTKLHHFGDDAYVTVGPNWSGKMYLLFLGSKNFDVAIKTPDVLKHLANWKQQLAPHVQNASSIIVGGHSRGGVIATVVASWIHANWPGKLKWVVTLGTPRIFKPSDNVYSGWRQKLFEVMLHGDDTIKIAANFGANLVRNPLLAALGFPAVVVNTVFDSFESPGFIWWIDGEGHNISLYHLRVSHQRQPEWKFQWA